MTCSDTRTPETDTSGQLIMHLLKSKGHEVAGYHIVKDEPSQIRETITTACADQTVQAIIVNGGTGISRRDSTFETVDGMLEKRLDGFGEVFRYLTYQEIGSPAIMSRATAGIVKGRVLFSTPVRKTPFGWRWKNSFFPNSATSSKNCRSKRVLSPAPD